METVLKFGELTKYYGSYPALRGIDLSVYSGRKVGLLGKNGSGKTTLIKLAAGLLKPDSGTVTVNGMPIGKDTKKIVSYLPDRNCISDFMTAADAVKMFSDFYDDFNAAKAIDTLSALGVDITVRLGTLPKGIRERVGVSLTMSRNARLYLLDEPLGSADPAAMDFILDKIFETADSDAAMLIATNRIADTERLFDDVIILQNGTVRSYDSAENMRRKNECSIEEHFREVYKCWES